MSCLYTWYQNCYMPELVHSLKKKKKKKRRRLIHALIISTGHILSFKLNLWQTLALLDLFKEKDTMATSFLSPAASLISYCIIRKLQTKRETTHKRILSCLRYNGFQPHYMETENGVLGF